MSAVCVCVRLCVSKKEKERKDRSECEMAY